MNSYDFPENLIFPTKGAKPFPSLILSPTIFLF